MATSHSLSIQTNAPILHRRLIYPEASLPNKDRHGAFHADFEAFVEEVGEPTSATLPPVLTGPPPPEVIAKILDGAQRHQIEIPPPPDGAH